MKRILSLHHTLIILVDCIVGCKTPDIPPKIGSEERSLVTAIFRAFREENPQATYLLDREMDSGFHQEYGDILRRVEGDILAVADSMLGGSCNTIDGKKVKYGDSKLVEAEGVLQMQFPRPWTVESTLQRLREEISTDSEFAKYWIRILAASKDRRALNFLLDMLFEAPYELRSEAASAIGDYFTGVSIETVLRQWFAHEGYHMGALDQQTINRLKLQGEVGDVQDLIPLAMLEEFVCINSNASKLPLELAADGIQWLPAEVRDEEGGIDNEKLHARFGENSVVVSISRPVFSPDGKYALVYRGWYRDPLWGSGHFAVFVNVNGNWRIFMTFGHWLSDSKGATGSALAVIRNSRWIPVEVHG